MHTTEAKCVYSISNNDWKDSLDLNYELFDLRDRFTEAKSIQDRWSVIREYYREYSDKIIEEIKKGRNWNVYSLPFIEHFTPIELEVFNDIRCAGLPFHPQYPVGKYFIDFADPYRKIAIEADGKHHLKRLLLDYQRDQFLMSKGWVTYRIPGVKTFRTFGDLAREMGFGNVNELWEVELDYEPTDPKLIHLIERYFGETSEGIIQTIKNRYYSRSSR